MSVKSSWDISNREPKIYCVQFSAFEVRFLNTPPPSPTNPILNCSKHWFQPVGSSTLFWAEGVNSIVEGGF